MLTDVNDPHLLLGSHFRKCPFLYATLHRSLPMTVCHARRDVGLCRPHAVRNTRLCTFSMFFFFVNICESGVVFQFFSAQFCSAVILHCTVMTARYFSTGADAIRSACYEGESVRNFAVSARKTKLISRNSKTLCQNRGRKRLDLSAVRQCFSFRGFGFNNTRITISRSKLPVLLLGPKPGFKV